MSYRTQDIKNSRKFARLHGGIIEKVRGVHNKFLVSRDLSYLFNGDFYMRLLHDLILLFFVLVLSSHSRQKFLSKIEPNDVINFQISNAGPIISFIFNFGIIFSFFGVGDSVGDSLTDYHHYEPKW